MRLFIRSMLMVFMTFTLTIASSHATTLQKLGLNDLTERADKIFRGVVTDIEQTSVQIGGGDLPVVRYRLKVAEQLKGKADVVKGENAYVEIMMVGSIKDSAPRSDGLVRFEMFKDIPRLQMGSDYVLFTTPASSAGLSTMVGLGQGAFNVFSSNKQDMVMNQFGNSNIDMANGDAMTYESLKQAVSAAMAQ